MFNFGQPTEDPMDLDLSPVRGRIPNQQQNPFQGNNNNNNRPQNSNPFGTSNGNQPQNTNSNNSFQFQTQCQQPPQQQQQQPNPFSGCTNDGNTSGVCVFGNPSTPQRSVSSSNCTTTTTPTTTTTTNNQHTTQNQPNNSNNPQIPESLLQELGQVVDQCAQYFCHTGVTHWKERTEAADVLKKCLMTFVEHKATLPSMVPKKFLELAPLLSNQLKDNRPQLLISMLQCLCAMVQACGENFAEVAYNLIPSILLLLKKQKNVVKETEQLLQVILLYCPHYSYVEYLVQAATKSTHPGTRIVCMEYLKFLIEGWADTATPDHVKHMIMHAVQAMVQDSSSSKARQVGRACLQTAGKAWPQHANTVLEHLQKTNPEVFKQLQKC